MPIPEGPPPGALSDMDGDEALSALGGGGGLPPQLEALLTAILGNGERIDPRTLQMILMMLQQGGDATPGGVL